MWIRQDVISSGRIPVLMVALAAACGGTSSAGRPAPGGEEEGGSGTAGDAVLTAEDLRNVTYSRVEEMIAARVPGVQVLRTPDGEYALRIRGTGSISGGNDPLIIIDGSPIYSGGSSAALGAINPEDVAKIEVLKDAQSTSFYGVRGANGVIIITTKRKH